MTTDDRPKAQEIDARPTKGLFITMLVKDVPLIRAILDLVDNCIDGAKRLRKNDDFHNLFVRVEAYPGNFKIADNCGGIPVVIARDYAFRFGRPPGMPSTPHSVGQFGVGMKRALFKLGSYFKITSTTDATSFNTELDVAEWQKDDNNWSFPFEPSANTEQIPEDNMGTIILVSRLHEPVAEKFNTENFIGELRSELEAANQESLDKGLTITLNGIPLQYQPTELLQSVQLQPALREVVFTSDNLRGLYQEDNLPQVTARIYAGIAKSDPSAAGWYIFCNGRLVLKADQTITTGWGEGEGTSIPKYHNQFARFRGFVYLDSDDARLLPWNTTKTGVDVDSPIYRHIYLVMITMMRPVIDFLNKLDAEKEPSIEDKTLHLVVENADSVKLSDVQASEIFIVRSEVRPQGPRMQRIQYSKPEGEIERVKHELGVNSLKEIGEKTFEYYLRMECDI